MRRIAALAALAAAVVTAAAAPGARGAAPPRIVEPPDALVRLVDDHARAWTGRDRALLARTSRAGPFADERLRAFDNAAALQVEQRLRISTQFSGDIASPRMRARYPGLDVQAYHVIDESRIGGYDLEPFVEDAFLTFVREGADADDPYDGWRIAAGDDFEALGIFSPTKLWDAGPVHTATSEHFLAVAHADQLSAVQALLPQAERALARVGGYWPRPIGRRYVIVAPSTTAELGEMIQATVDLSKFVAFAAATITSDEGYKPAGVRVFLHMSHVKNYNDEGKEAIFTHELIHAVTRPLAGPHIPTWVEEGLAMHGSEPEQPAVARRADRDAFPTDDEFYVGSTAQIVTRYRQAQSAFFALAARSKTDGIAKFYESLGSARVAPGTDEHHVERAAREALGWSIGEWTLAWRQRVG